MRILNAGGVVALLQEENSKKLGGSKNGQPPSRLTKH